jgi:hypothetical protein
MGYLIGIVIFGVSSSARRALPALFIPLFVGAYAFAQIQLQHARERLEQKHLQAMHSKSATSGRSHGRE